MPGCTIRWSDPTKVGNVDYGVLFADVDQKNIRWVGGTFQSIPKEQTVGGITYLLYPLGPILRLLGDELHIEDVTIDGYNGIATIVEGDRIRILNPTIRNPQRAIPANTFTGQPDAIDPNGAGIRVFQGTGFRCYGGDIESGGDAAIQFSGDGGVDGDISDGLYQGVHCVANGGRMILVGSTNPRISNVRFVGITGEARGGGDCIRIQNKPRGQAGVLNPISHVVFRDVSVSHGSVPGYAVAIENELPTGPVVSDILFDNLSIATPSDTAFAVFATVEPPDPSQRLVRNVTWRNGSITNPFSDVVEPLISLAQLDRGLFQHIRISCGGNHPAIACGEKIKSDQIECRDVVFEDVVVTNLANGRTGVRFGQAVNCGFVGGSIAEAAGAQAIGAILTAQSTRCFVEATDVTGVTAVAPIQVSGATEPRVADVFGVDLTVVPPMGFGAIGDRTMTSHAIAGDAGFARAKTTSGSEPVALDTIDGGAVGDVLVLSRSVAQGSKKVLARDGNGNLRLAGNFQLDKGDDTLVLLKSGPDWLQVARSNNS